MSLSFKELLEISAKTHGHMCPGQVLGVRMGMLGLALLGFEAPLDDANIKKVIIFVEIDRCAADALTSTTGVKLGRRSLKFKDYGLMAATFVNLADNRAYRVAVRENCREKASMMLPEELNAVQREIKAYSLLSADDLFKVEEVVVKIKPEDLPGFHQDKKICEQCGAMIRHRRDVRVDGRSLCRICAGGAYFDHVSVVNNPDRFDPLSSGGRP